MTNVSPSSQPIDSRISQLFGKKKSPEQEKLPEAKKLFTAPPPPPLSRQRSASLIQPSTKGSNSKLNQSTKDMEISRSNLTPTQSQSRPKSRMSFSGTGSLFPSQNQSTYGGFGRESLNFDEGHQETVAPPLFSLQQFIDTEKEKALDRPVGDIANHFLSARRGQPCLLDTFMANLYKNLDEKNVDLSADQKTEIRNIEPINKTNWEHANKDKYVEDLKGSELQRYKEEVYSLITEKIREIYTTRVQSIRTPISSIIQCIFKNQNFNRQILNGIQSINKEIALHILEKLRDEQCTDKNKEKKIKYIEIKLKKELKTEKGSISKEEAITEEERIAIEKEEQAFIKRFEDNAPRGRKWKFDSSYNLICLLSNDPNTLQACFSHYVFGPNETSQRIKEFIEAKIRRVIPITLERYKTALCFPTNPQSPIDRAILEKAQKENISLENKPQLLAVFEEGEPITIHKLIHAENILIEGSLSEMLLESGHDVLQRLSGSNKRVTPTDLRIAHQLGPIQTKFKEKWKRNQSDAIGYLALRKLPNALIMACIRNQIPGDTHQTIFDWLTDKTKEKREAAVVLCNTLDVTSLEKIRILDIQRKMPKEMRQALDNAYYAKLEELLSNSKLTRVKSPLRRGSFSKSQSSRTVEPHANGTVSFEERNASYETKGQSANDGASSEGIQMPPSGSTTKEDPPKGNNLD